jgi:Dolichyl-phosphate-mannose-protein mannosyltransferase
VTPSANGREKLVLSLLFVGLAAARLCHSGIVWVEEAYPAAAAIQVLSGKMLYRDVWFDKPPLSALLYLVWDARMGVVLRIAGAAFVFACCLMLWRFARDLWGPREGLVAALLLGFFLTFGIPAAVMALAPDLLMVLPHIAAIYLAWRGRPLLSGFVAGIALLVNAKAFFVLVACIFFAWRGAGWLLAGFAVPNILALIWFGQPYIDQVWRWGAMYSEQTFSFATGFTRTANWAGFQSALIVGGAFALWKENRWRWKMIAWLLLSLAAVAAGWRFFPRYYFQLLPVLALLAARGYTLLGRCRVAMLALLLIPLIRFGPRYVMLTDDLLHHRQTNWSDVALNEDSQAAADHVERPGTLLVWGYRPDIFTYTRMPAGSRFLDSQPLTGVLADRHLTSSEAFAPAWAARNRRELIASDPTWIVDGLGPLNPALAITNYPDLHEWLANYHEVGRTRFSIIYKLK